MLYYLFKHRKVTFTLLTWIILTILTIIIMLLYASIFNDYEGAIGLIIILSIVWFIFGIGISIDSSDKLYFYVFKNIKTILRRYESKQKYFKFFYNEVVHSKLLSVITSIRNKYEDFANYKGRDYPLLNRTLSKFRVFLNSYPIATYDEAIKNLNIYYLLDEHLTLLYNFYNEYSALNDKCRELIKVKEEELDKILKEKMSVEFVSKTKTAQMLGYCEE